MKFLSIFSLLFIPLFSVFSEMHHHYIKHTDTPNDSFLWTKQNIVPFEELLITWNASRPTQGHYSIYVSLNTQKWSPWLVYAKWGSDFQKGAISKLENVPVRVYQDAVETLEGEVGHGFKIKVIAENGADISNLKSIHVCSSKPSSIAISSSNMDTHDSYHLAVDGLSQMALMDERGNRLCSPTSTTAVVRFLKNEHILNPLQFAENVWDASFDIFGNWVFNVAEAYNQINSPLISCWVERLNGFQNILDSLKEGFPVVISVRGPLPGSAQPYKNGHLLAVIGFENKTREVICMDPAFDTDDETTVRYNLDDLMTAWNRRKNVAYIFRSSTYL
ncbi:hypothetical protein COB21_01665 [Candidatus Aerophobetes bacterium]|uniref:Peptidase C39-like domain-containing protein n=1 Tax=Aerophobetes bacterium TaxID=2030807 RepID=A0A2A4X7K8_UNCAE|nr:MAG: hypothetical protein COB21_01665 [Candidatus Aerophobetes bacterium]